jgi:hypothetical protein
MEIAFIKRDLIKKEDVDLIYNEIISKTNSNIIVALYKESLPNEKVHNKDNKIDRVASLLCLNATMVCNGHLYNELYLRIVKYIRDVLDAQLVN